MFSLFLGKMAKYFLVLNDARATELHKLRTEYYKDWNNNPGSSGAGRGRGHKRFGGHDSDAGPSKR